jgi:NAD(P)H-dependent FMN reductase
MITVIQATNRPDSNTEFISRHIDQWLKANYKGSIGHISMVDMPPEILSASAYEVDSIPEKIVNIQDQFMVPAEKFIWLLPEYNGSFPGVLKLFIDAISVRKYEATFKLKKSMLIGVATGRAGNVRGLDHMAGILIHMKSLIFPRLLPISKVSELMDEEGRINHGPTLKALDDHLKEFIAF